jgi:hypothetical protein
MKPNPPGSAFEQEFPYGWRFVKRVGPDGVEELEQVPLTLEDVLHPQEGDVISGNIRHDTDCTYLATVFRSRPFGPPVVLVTHDVLVNWGVEGIGNHAPDVAVFVGLSRDPDPATGLLDLAGMGGRCELVIEVVSPSTRVNDVVHKFDHYYRAGIPVYVIIDQEREDGPRRLRAYRRKSHGYAEIESDDRYRVDLPLLGVMIGLRDDRAVCWDLRTHRELGDYSQVVLNGQEAERQRDEAIQARDHAEQAISEQVEARHEAQRQTAAALKEADRLRERADKQRQETERAQKEADRQREEADKQRQAREEIEKQKKTAEEQAALLIRELQEKLRQLQGGSDPTTAQ